MDIFSYGTGLIFLGLTAACLLSCSSAPGHTPGQKSACTPFRDCRLVLPDILKNALTRGKSEPISNIEFKVFEKQDWCVLRIEAGEHFGVAAYHLHEHPLKAAKQETAQKALSKLLTGKRTTDLEEVWNTAISEGMLPGLIWMADVALWDLAGRVAGQPVYKLVGGNRKSIKAYASSPCSMGDYNRYASALRQVIKRGYHGYKIHPYVKIKMNEYPAVQSGDAEKDKGLLVRLREEAGPDFLLMWDNFRSYTYEESVEVGGLLQKHGYAWMESPMLEDDDTWMNRYIDLCRELEIPVCAPEHYPGAHWSRITWMDEGACDINRTDPNYGGFTGPMILALECEKRGIPLELHFHHPYEYNLQIAAASDPDTVRYVEIFDGWPPGSLNAYNRRKSGSGSRKFNHGPFHLLNPSFIGPDGLMPVPDSPGMGIEVDWPNLEKKLEKN